MATEFGARWERMRNLAELDAMRTKLAMKEKDRGGEGEKGLT